MESPPEGSNIRIASDRGEPTVVIPPTSGVMRYPSGLFLLCWLVGWAFGFKSAITQLWSGNFQFFLVVWLFGWTLGGIFAAYMAFRTFRPSVPETLELRRTSFAYDSGLAPPPFNTSRKSTREIWKSMFPERIRLELDRSQLQSLRLRETDTGNRLTFDIGSERIEIGPTASEVEREWLARLLARRYSLPQMLNGVKSAEVGP